MAVKIAQSVFSSSLKLSCNYRTRISVNRSVSATCGEDVYTKAKKCVEYSDTIMGQDLFDHIKRILGMHNLHLGLIVMLFAKTARSDEICTKDMIDKMTSLAEIAELMHMSHYVHGIVNPYLIRDIRSQHSDKLCVILGDFLMSKCGSKLANIRNQNVVELMSSALRDLKEGEFYSKKSSELYSTAVDDWAYYNELQLGRLLAKACKSCVEVGKGDMVLQEKGYIFGKSTSLVLKSSLELEYFCSHSFNGPFSLMSAPVLFHLEFDPLLYFEMKDDLNKINYYKLFKGILKGPGIARTKDLRQKHVKKAKEALGAFKKCGSSEALCKILDNSCVSLPI